MPDTFSSRLRLRLQETGGNTNTWGQFLNDGGLQLIEDAIAGRASIPIVGDTSLTVVNGALDQSRMAIIALTGTPSATFRVTVPANTKLYAIENLTNAIQNIRAQGGAVDVPIPIGSRTLILVDGAEARKVGLDSTTSNRFTGEIVAYFGLLANVPTGWQVCDGTNGTPDLRDRFIVAAGTTYPYGSSGGSTAITGGATTSAGSHTHTVGGTTLTEAQSPVHNHRIYAADNALASNADGWLVAAAMGIPGEDVGPFAYRENNGAGTQLIEDAGSGDPHTHTLTTDGTHTHSVTGSVTPPYYSLYYIMKL